MEKAPALATPPAVPAPPRTHWQLLHSERKMWQQMTSNTIAGYEALPPLEKEARILALLALPGLELGKK